MALALRHKNGMILDYGLGSRKNLSAPFLLAAPPPYEDRSNPNVSAATPGWKPAPGSPEEPPDCSATGRDVQLLVKGALYTQEGRSWPQHITPPGLVPSSGTNVKGLMRCFLLTFMRESLWSWCFEDGLIDMTS